MTSIKDNGVVEFEFFRSGVRNVQLIGDFTGWDNNPLAMTPVGNGWWKATAKLASGEYRFRYFADGQWYTDYASYGIEMTEHGMNSVLVVQNRQPQANKANNATLAA